MDEIIVLCDVCGSKATQMSCDILEIESKSPWMDFRRGRVVRYGCEIHNPPQSRTFYLDGRCESMTNDRVMLAIANIGVTVD